MNRKHLETTRHVKARARLRNRQLLRKTMTFHLRLARRRWQRRSIFKPPPAPK